jgi:SpoVK/Ycf46/Vps4 family AAA+-type ATPase
MLLRGELRDAAVSTAKAYAHGEVEPRHVLFAIARRFRAEAAVEPHFGAARAALEPHGSAHGTPKVGEAAEALLQSIGSEKEAVAAFEAAMAKGASGGGGAAAAGSQARQSVEAQTVKEQAAAKPAGAKAEEVSAVLAELDSLIGLGPVKAQVRSVLAVVQANTERTKAGLKAVNPSLHLVFTGPPGTGKTTVARLVARLYAAAGALPGAGFTEATRADLIAGYVGQTALKTTELIARTRPGVLFIDEAYALTPTSTVDFGSEAIATLVKAMEDYRDDFAIIVAGYGDEMTDFIGSNPGLRSRFKTYIAFPDFGPEELLRIFELFAKEAGIAMAAGVKEKALEVMKEGVAQSDFGNARFVRSVFEQAYARMAARAAADGRVSVSELLALEPDDLVLDMDTLRREQRRLGFRTE